MRQNRPSTPRTNGKADRFIKILLEVWAYGMPCGASAARDDLSPARSLVMLGGGFS